MEAKLCLETSSWCTSINTLNYNSRPTVSPHNNPENFKLQYLRNTQEPIFKKIIYGKIFASAVYFERFLMYISKKSDNREENYTRKIIAVVM
jgi:hypothetical protein